MPIRPVFNISQTESNVSIEIRVPHVRVSVDSVEVAVEGERFHFSSPPYLLILSFPFPFAETDGSETAKYDPSREGGMVTVHLCKKESQWWPDLDLIGKLMQPRQKTANMPLRATILSEERAGEGEGEGEGEPLENPSLESQIQETAFMSSEEHTLPSLTCIGKQKQQYGFLHIFSFIFSDFAREGIAAEMLQLPNPDDTDEPQRKELRILMENENFDPDRYLGDLEIKDDYLYQCAMAMRPHWSIEASEINQLTKQMELLNTDEPKSFFSNEENSQLAAIPYPILPSIIEHQSSKKLLYGLVDLLFSYTYDHLLTDGDPTVESSWTISNLSCLLSWLDDSFTSAQNVICHSIRRSLIFPYIRNFDFALYCMQQVLDIMKQGRRCILRSLLQVRQILERSETHYLGNKLFVDPYMAWLQRFSVDEIISTVASEVELVLREFIRNTALGKESLELKLEDIDNQFDTDTSDDNTTEDEAEEEQDQNPDQDTQEKSRMSLLDCDIQTDDLSPTISADLTVSRQNSSSNRPLIQEL